MKSMNEIKLEAAIETAVDKMIAAGMTEGQAATYVHEHLEEILAWCLRLIAEHERQR